MPHPQDHHTTPDPTSRDLPAAIDTTDQSSKILFSQQVHQLFSLAPYGILP
jgi:hypothetical protein